MWYCVILCDIQNWLSISQNCDIISQNITYCFGNFVDPPLVAKQIFYRKTNLIFHLHSLLVHTHTIKLCVYIYIFGIWNLYTVTHIVLHTIMQVMHMIFQERPCVLVNECRLFVLQSMTNLVQKQAVAAIRIAHLHKGVQTNRSHSLLHLYDVDVERSGTSHTFIVRFITF